MRTFGGCDRGVTDAAVVEVVGRVAVAFGQIVATAELALRVHVLKAQRPLCRGQIDIKRHRCRLDID